MSEFLFDDLGDGRFALSGELGYDTASEIFERSKELFEPHSTIEVDFDGVTDSDSAGLAVLLEWINWAKYFIREIHYQNVPRQIRAIAQISEVEDMLEAGARWTGQSRR